MATATVLSAERTLAIDNSLVASGAVNGSGHLILTRKDGSTIDCGVTTPLLLTEDQNDARYVSRVTHNGTVYATRPPVPAGMCEYVGPTTPTTWQTGDTWVNTA